MLHMFHTYVASALSDYCVCFAIVSSVFQVFLLVFQIHVSSVSSAFGCMLQVLHLNVSKVDRMLHLPPRILLPHLDVSSFFCCLASSSQTTKGGRPGPVGGERRGMVARTRAHALPFYYAGKNRLPLDSSWWAGIPLPSSAQAHVAIIGWLVGVAFGRAARAFLRRFRLCLAPLQLCRHISRRQSRSTC